MASSYSHSQTILQTPATVYQAASFEDAVLRLVKHDPFATIGELADELSRSGQYDESGWWSVFFVLRRHSLIKKRSRFNFARGRR